MEHLGERDKIGAPQALDSKTDEVQPQSTTIQTGGFYGNNAQVPQQQSIPSRAATSSSTTSHANIYPIEALSPYAHKWTIKARCTNKSDIKTWHNKNGEGKLFSVNLLDESGEIRGTGFNDQCDQLYEVFREGGVYYITSPCRVQMAKKQFTNLNNDYELTFERDTLVEKVSSDVVAFRRVKISLILHRRRSRTESRKFDSTLPALATCSLLRKIPPSTRSASSKKSEKPPRSSRKPPANHTTSASSRSSTIPTFPSD